MHVPNASDSASCSRNVKHPVAFCCAKRQEFCKCRCLVGVRTDVIATLRNSPKSPEATKQTTYTPPPTQAYGSLEGPYRQHRHARADTIDHAVGGLFIIIRHHQQSFGQGWGVYTRQLKAKEFQHRNTCKAPPPPPHIEFILQQLQS